MRKRAVAVALLVGTVLARADTPAPGDAAVPGRPAGFQAGIWIHKFPGEYAAFKLETPAGLRIVADPYALDEPVAPDIVTESHQDPDHDDTSKLTGRYTVLSKPGEWTMQGVHITGIAGKHNKPDTGVTNVIFVYELGGVRIAHLASQGARLDEAQLAALQGVDVLMLQCFLSEFSREQKLTGEECRRIVDRVHPRIVIPEHGAPRVGEYIARRLGTAVVYAPPQGIVVTREELDRIEAPRIVDMDRKEAGH